MKLRGSWRKIRSRVGIRADKVAIRSHVPWYIKAGGYGIALGIGGAIAWMVVDNSYRITGFNREEAKAQIALLTDENQKLKSQYDAAKTQASERDSQLKVEKSSMVELTKNLAQLQEENANLKEDIGFLRNVMSSGSVPEGLAISNFKVEPDALPNEHRYRLLLTQGGQRKQEFKGKIQLVIRYQLAGQLATQSVPTDAELKAPGGEIDFRYYQKVDGRFRIPEGAQLKAVQVRVLGLPGYDVRSQKLINL